VIFAAGCSQIDAASVEGQSETPKKKVLIVTGVDYPGHKWKLTTPVLAKAIAADKRLDVTITEEPNDLASDTLGDYDVIVLHFMDWEIPDPGPKARVNLKRVVQNGKGLVLVHFACGAFQEWPEFAKLAGRAWDPKLRGHDPHGKFTVKITDDRHPAMKGMKEFDTVDELYTCLAGQTPIKVLATARSKVDDKAYPMAFVLNYGKGRVFHSVLGHDVQAFESPYVGRLYRNACAWAAGLEPSDE
jgi:type 1 glutamine amidotransferase